MATQRYRGYPKRTTAERDGNTTCTRQSVNSAASIAQIQSADIIKKKAYKTIF
jgi:hypothetical protein